jgi:HK97 family phage portal protein
MEKVLPAGILNNQSITLIINPGARATDPLEFQPDYQQSKQITYYKEIIYDCINRISQPFSQVPFSMVDAKGEVIKSHPFYDVMSNPFQGIYQQGITQVDLLYETALDILIFGNAIWWIGKSGKNITNIVPLSPELIEPIVTKRDVDGKTIAMVTGYAYGINKDIKYNCDEIVHFQYIDPRYNMRHIWGLSPIQAHYSTFDIYAKMLSTQLDAFGKNGLPTMLVTIDGAKTGDTSQASMERIRENITNKFFKRKEAVAVLDMNLMDLKLLDQKFNELQFIEGKKQIKSEIASAFNLHPMFLGEIGDVNYANAKAALYWFAKWTLSPFVERIAMQLNQDLIHPFYGDDVTLEFENVVPADHDEMRADYSAAFSMGAVTPNEVRVNLLDLPPIEKPEMDVTYLSGMVMPIDLASEPPEPETITITDEEPNPEDNINVTDGEPDEEPMDDSEEAKGLIITIDEPCIIEKKISGAARDRNRKRWTRLNHLAERVYRGKYTKVLDAIFESQIDGVMSRLNTFSEKQFKRTPKKNELNFILFDPKSETKRTVKDMTPPVESLLEYSTAAHIEAMQLPLDFETAWEPMLKLINTGGRAEGVFKFAKEITEETDSALRATLNEGILKGETIQQLSDRIAAVKADAQGFRSVRIARTEINGGYNRAGVETAKTAVEELGGEARKFWWTAGPAQRQTHNENEREAIERNGLPMDEAYQADGLMFPGDPQGEAGDVANCMCAGGIEIIGMAPNE